MAKALSDVVLHLADLQNHQTIRRCQSRGETLCCCKGTELIVLTGHDLTTALQCNIRNRIMSMPFMMTPASCFAVLMPLSGLSNNYD